MGLISTIFIVEELSLMLFTHICYYQSMRILLSLFLLVFTLSPPQLLAQKVTKVSGKVIDANTKELLPFVNISFKGTNVGASTDIAGEFEISTRFPSDTLVASYIGYEDQYFIIKQGEKQKVDFKLRSSGIALKQIVFTEQKGKYSRKNNPSLDLAKKVTANAYQNHLKGLPHYQYDQHEIVRVDLNNITDKFKERRFVRNLDFLWDFIDTSEINGRTFLPVFLREIISTVYYRNKPKSEKEYRHAVNYTNIVDKIGLNTINNAIDALYTDVDVYTDIIPLLENQFVSPLSNISPGFYRYYIQDTTIVNGREAINLAFIPETKGSLGFIGNMYISNDNRYTVLKIDMGIVKDINLNFVRDLRVVQEFEPYDENFIKTKDEVIIDYSITSDGLGVYGNKTVYYNKFKFDPIDNDKFSMVKNIINNPDGLIQNQNYWQESRIGDLTKNDLDTYELRDTLIKDKYFNRYMYLGKVLTSGFIPVGPVEFGPVAAFTSFNDVEGFQPRFGGWSTYGFSKRLLLQSYFSYGTMTDQWKYSAGATFTFNENYRDNPRHFIRATAEKASSFPGQDLQFFSPDNVLLSFRRGETTRMLLTDKYELMYEKGTEGFSFNIGARHKTIKPYGTTEFLAIDPVEGEQVEFNQIQTNEVFGMFRFAPNEQYVQGKQYRTQILNEYPIFTFSYTVGLDGLEGGDYNYTRLGLNIFKQFEWKRTGTTDIILDGGKTFGNVPYVLNYIPAGNQTYGYFLNSYNMMNFFEFSIDQYASINIEHYFYGFILNRVPLLRRLKLREIITFKGLYGSLSDENNPLLDPTLVQFTDGENGGQATYTLDNKPYIEASIGISNIFKILRVDVVKRFTHLENPNLPILFGTKGMGVRAKFYIEF